MKITQKTTMWATAAAMTVVGAGAAVAPAQASVSVSAPAPAAASQAPSASGIELATASTAPASAPVADSSFSAQVSQEVLAQVNALRAQAGLQPLAGHAQLNSMSTGWSQQQAAATAPSHNPSFIVETSAAGSTGMAENIAYSVGSQGSVEQTASYFVDFWVNSPSHYANIMDPSFNAAGFGLAEGADGNVYATQNFGTF